MNARSTFAAVALAALAGLALAASAPLAGPATFGGDPYPLDTCPVSGEKLGKDAEVVVLEGMKDKLLDGTQVKFCCGKCISKFKADPAKFAKEYETKVVAAQKPGYKATTCPISGKPLGDGAVDVVVNGQLVRTCCGGCVGAVKADPKAAIAKVAAPAKAADPKK